MMVGTAQARLCPPYKYLGEAFSDAKTPASKN
jgi:hypothetical protein